MLFVQIMPQSRKTAVKLLGGIKGIAHNWKALDEYFLIVSEMGNIIQDFCDVFNIQNEAPKRTQHYQLAGSKNERISDNIKNISDVFYSNEINFEKSDVLFNVLTKKVLPENFVKEFLEIDREGCKLCEQFIKE